MQKTFDKTLFAYLVFGFIISTIIGTLSHELGHYIVAYFYGYKPHISYGYCVWDLTSNKTEYNERDNFFITLGGPMQTILTGSFGFFILFLNRQKLYKKESLKFLNWLFVFIALFWLRQVANYTIEIFQRIFLGQKEFIGDETYLAETLKINSFFINGLSAIVGFLVLVYIVFKIIPVRQRLTFIFSGLVGGVLGFFIWLEWIGKLLMP